MKKILIVDDEKGILETCKKTLVKEGYIVDTEDNPEKVISSEELYDIYILDIVMPKIDGIKLAEKIREKSSYPVIILMTAYPSLDSAVKAIKTQVFDYLIKPFTPQYLISVVKRAEEFLDLREENKLLRKQTEKKYDTENIVYRSEKMREIVETAKKVADVECDVLITGESGVGKELIARAIHKMSPRKNQRFVPVNLSTIPETLIESELFGYEKGAFTDARTPKIGLIEYANKGTLFLDEITEVSQNIQVKLLRFIQERTIRKIGGNQEIPVDVRIIYATNRDIEEEVRSGRFREDLWWRINVFRIHIPPLRERKEDIIVLAEYYLKKYSEEIGKKVSRISDEVMELFLNYSWPGNVRELQNVIRRAIIVCESDKISIKDIDYKLNSNQKNVTQKGLSNGKFFELKNKVIEDFERRYITSLYQKTNGDIKKMIEISGIPKTTLYRMLKKYIGGFETS